MSRLSRPTRVIGSAVLVFALALAVADAASAELVARGIQRGMLALGPKGMPSVAYVRGANVFVATRASGGRWRTGRAGSLSGGSQVMAFAVGAKGPVALVQSANAKTLVLIRRNGSRWQRIRLARGLPATVELGWPGLVLDGRGLPIVAYTRWNAATFNSQLLLARVDARGRVGKQQKITAEGFPQSYVAPPAAPIIVGGQVHVIESYGYRTQVATIEWHPQKRTWEGLFIDAGHGEWPLGPVLAARSASGTVYAALTQAMYAIGAVPVTLATRSRLTNTEVVLERALATALALPSSGPEIAANEWVGAGDLELEGEAQVWAGTVVSHNAQVELDGWIAGLAASPRGGRDLLMARPGGLSWFHAPRRLATRVDLDATAEQNGRVSISGSVDGARSGKVTLYRERPGSPRQLVGSATLAGGSFSFADRPPARPLVYRAVYTDPASGIPYASLLRRPIQ